MDKKFYLTKQGLEKLKNDFAILKYLKAGRLDRETPTPFDSDELNAEFIAFKEDLDLLNVKIEELEYILHNFEIITSPKDKTEREKVNLGAKVLIDIDGEKDEFVIVGTLEANPSLGKISNESPVGRLLMGKKVGETVTLKSPVCVKYKIQKVSY